jgi:hypothetical protein
MPRDYGETIRALRAKAADKAVTPEEAKILREKADELEAKHGNVNSPFTDDTTTTSRDGRYWEYAPYNVFYPKPETEEARRARWQEAYRQTWDLFLRQNMWNPPPEEDIVEEGWQDAPDEDYGYDIYEGDDYE